MDATTVVRALTEVFFWLGLGLVVPCGVAALVARLADGAWQPSRGVVFREDGEVQVRWFGGNDGVGEATPSAQQLVEIGERDEIDLFYRPDRPGRFRLQRRSPLARYLLALAVGSAALALVSATVQLVVIAING